MSENDIEATKQKVNDNACIKDYNAHKNKETLEAQKIQHEHMSHFYIETT